jgi:hypothetical protein
MSNLADSCSNKKGCAAGYERYEYGPGCCACRRDACTASVMCGAGSTCPPGQHYVLAGCCGVCVLDGKCKEGEGLCTSFVCPKGYRAHGDGTCCSSCEPDEAFCEDKRKAYEAYKASTLDQLGALKCVETADCTVQTFTNKCAGDCGTAIAKAKVSQVQNALTTYANQNCSECPLIAFACPGVVLTAKCSQNKCVLSP